MDYTHCIRLRVHPSPQDPSKRIISRIHEDNTETHFKKAQFLWDEEQKIQRDMGTEKFFVHTYLMQPCVEDNEGWTLRRRTVLAVEFVDSGHLYLYQMDYGVSQWCFKPTLGGVDYGQDERGHDRNLEGFKPCSHPFFFGDMVPVTTRTFRSLVALLHLCRPEHPQSPCNKYFAYHDHYIINIYLRRPGLELDTVCTKHIICGDTELENLFDTLCCPNIGATRTLAEINSIGELIAGTRLTYKDSLGLSIDQIGWPKNYVVRLLPFPLGLKPIRTV